MKKSMNRKICSAITMLFMFASLLMPTAFAADVVIGEGGYAVLGEYTEAGDFADRTVAWWSSSLLTYKGVTGVYGDDASNKVLKIYKTTNASVKDQTGNKYINVLPGATGIQSGDTWNFKWRMARGNDWQGTIKFGLVATDSSGKSTSNSLDLTKDGKLTFASDSKTSWSIANYCYEKWYDFDLRYTIGSPNKITLYVDGVKIIDNYEYTLANIIGVSSRFYFTTSSNSYSTLEDTTIYLDDIKSYLYRTAQPADPTVTVSGSSTDVVVDRESKVVLLDSMTAGEALGSLSGNYTNAEYLDKSYNVLGNDAASVDGYIRLTTANKTVYKIVTNDTSVLTEDFNDGVSSANKYGTATGNMFEYGGGVFGKSDDNLSFNLVTTNFAPTSLQKVVGEWYLQNLSGKSTVEYSIYGDMIGSIVPNVQVAWNGSISTDYTINDGSIKFKDGTTKSVVTKNRWVRVAMTVDTDADTVDYYVNGTHIYTRTFSGLNYYNRVKFEFQIPANSSISSAVTAIDDIKIYYGGYDGAKDSVTLTPYSGSGVVVLSEKNVIILPEDIDSVSGLKEALGGNYEIYDDETLESQDYHDFDMVDEDCCLVAVSPSGTTYAYYIITYDTFVYNEDFSDSAFDVSESWGMYTAHTTQYVGGIGGKNTDDLAFAMTTTHSKLPNSGSVAKPGLQKIIDTTSGIVTVEFSFYSSNPGAVVPSVSLKRDSSEIAKVELYNKAIGMSGVEGKAIITKNRWNRMAVIIDADEATDNVSYYINGEFAGKKTVNGLNGINIMRIDFICDKAGDTTITALDDIEIYYGDYNCDKDVITLLPSENSNVYVFEATSSIAVEQETDTIDELKSVLNGSSFKIYETEDFSVSTENVAPGKYLVAVSESGKTFGYYKIVNGVVEVSDISFEQNNGEVTASANVVNNTADNADYIICIASYNKSGSKSVLKSVAFDGLSVASGTEGSKYVNIKCDSGDAVKAFIWKSNLAPVAVSEYSAE